VTGFGRSGSMSNFFMADFTVATSSLPSSASARQRSEHDVLRVDLEVTTQLRARVAATVAVSAEHDEAPGHPLADLVRHDLHVIACPR
jgi:hypothetical protein